MSCLIQRNPESQQIEKVTAPNGEESVLYQHILNHLAEDNQEDLLAERAYREGFIGDPSLKEERALVYWGLAHRQKVEENFLDRNGEPIFPAVRSLIGLTNENDVQEEVGKVSKDSIIKFLKQEKLIYWKNGSYQVAAERKGATTKESNAGDPNLNRIKTMLSWFGIPESVISVKKNGTGTSIKFNPFSQSIEKSPKRTDSTTNTRTLIDFLKERFPQLKIEFRSEKQARDIYNDLQQRIPPEDRKELDFSRVKSFVHKGTVYLIENRVNNETTIEEVLHPFTYTIAENNKELFQQLHTAAIKDFPALHKEVESNYPKEAGFTAADRELELVTKALSKTFAQEYEKNAPRSILQLLNKVIEWFAKLVKDFGVFVGGEKQTVINVSELPSGINLTQIAQLLNTYDSQFLVDTSASMINYKVGSEKETFIENVKEKANVLQQKIIDDLYEIESGIVFIESEHLYINTATGLPYESTTTAINGKFDDPGNRYEMNRLFGNAFDRIMEDMVLGKTFDDIKHKVKNLNMELAERAYEQIQGYILGLTQDGSVVLPQLRVFDNQSGIAGSLDLLLIRPDGTKWIIDLKVSKNSVKDDSYYNHSFLVKEGSRLPGERLSKRQRHGVQVGVYKRLLETNGHYVDQTLTYHIWVDIEGEGADQEVKNFVVEGSEEHYPSENRAFVDKIVPTQPKADKAKLFRAQSGMGSIANDYGEVDEETRQSKEYLDAMDKLQVKMEDFSKKIRSNIDRIEMVRNTASLKPHKETVQKLSGLLALMREHLSRGQADLAYGKFLNHAKEELTELIKYLSDPSKKGENEYIQRILDADTYIKTYLGISNAPKWELGNRYQDKMLGEVQRLLEDAQNQIQSSLEDYILHMLKSNSSQKDITDEEWKHNIKEYVEISKGDLYLGDIDTSTDPLIRVAAKLYKQAKLRSMDRSKRFTKQVKEIANELAQAFGGAPDYDMIIETDAQGKYTGRIVQKIGSQFWNFQKIAKSKVLDEEERMKQYKKVYSPLDADPEKIAYNKQLFKDKKEWREFNQAEIRTAKGVEDGKYYKYIDEFKVERDKYEKYIPPHTTAEGKERQGRWVRREDTNKTKREYIEYRDKFYNFIDGYDSPTFDENGEFTGILVKDGGKSWVVKTEYIEIREVAGDGTDMTSAKWRALQAPKNGPDTRTERQKAMAKFYDFYIREMDETLGMLPLNVQKDMMGKMARVKGNLVNQMKITPSFFKTAAKGVSDWFSVRTYAKSALYNDDGTPMSQIPLFYVGSLRNEKRVESFQKKIEELEADYTGKKVSRVDYLKQKKRLQEELRVAESAVSADELEKDMAKSLMKFREMAESFSEMQNIEASLIAVRKMLAERQYTRKSAATGEPQIDKNTREIRKIKGEDSRTLERFREWMEMTFYNSSEVDKSKFDVIAKKFMSVTSMEAIGFNLLGPVHNYAMARLNTAIETWGGLFYKKEAGFRAIGAYTKDFIPGYLRSMGAKEGYYYKTKLPGSKYEALVNYFHMMRPNQSGDERGGIASHTGYGYLLSEAGEYAAQTKSGMAYLMSQDLTSKKMASGQQTADTLSIYDAFDFDEKTGELTLKEGYELPETQKHTITNYIWEMNKQMHGNYAWEDRMLIQKTTLGQMAAQFHKYVYPMFKARFQSKYYDENLGDMEGRYLTVWNFMRYCYEAEGTLLEKMKTAWKDMTPMQVKNMCRNGAELSFLVLTVAAFNVFKGLGSGMDKDDKRLRRFVNFLSWESSRQSKEILFWIPGAGLSSEVELIKNPFAMAGSYAKFADVLGEAAGLALPPYDDKIYYHSGPFKDQLKLTKKMKDLVPILKDLNRFSSFDQVTKFYVQ